MHLQCELFGNQLCHFLIGIVHCMSHISAVTGGDTMIYHYHYTTATTSTLTGGDTMMYYYHLHI